MPNSIDELKAKATGAACESCRALAAELLDLRTRISATAAAKGAVRSDAKKAAAKQRMPPKPVDALACTCGRGSPDWREHKTTCRRWRTMYKREWRAKGESNE